MMVGNQAILAYRRRKGLTQEELARELGVSSITVSRWETGARKIERNRLPQISVLTGIPPDELRPDLAVLFRRGS